MTREEDLQAAENELAYWKVVKLASEAALRRLESDLTIAKKQILVWERRRDKLGPVKTGGGKDGW